MTIRKISTHQLHVRVYYSCSCTHRKKFLSKKKFFFLSYIIVSHKKLMLLRWENSVLEKTKTSLPLSPPLSPHPSHPHQPPTSSKEEEEDDERQPIKRHSSPLFEELSDEEFEEGRKTADSADGDKDTRT